MANSTGSPEPTAEAAIDQPPLYAHRTRWQRVLIEVAKLVEGASAVVLLLPAGVGLALGAVPLAKARPYASEPDPATGLLPTGVAPAYVWWPLIALALGGIALSVWPGPPGYVPGSGQFMAGLLLGATVYLGWELGRAGSGYSTCYYPDCWPATTQQTLLALPIMVTALSMLIVPVLLRRRRWWWRIVVPVAVYAVATAAQVLAWEPLILPWLAGPPPS